MSLTSPMFVAGPIETIDETRVGGRQARLALAVLLVNRRRAVSRHELADALWPDVLPSSWEPALRGVLSRVRAMLAAAGFTGPDVLTTAFGCYQLHLPDEVTVDIEVVASALENAEAALRAEDAELACREAEIASRIAGRPFLVGEDSPWVEGVRAELRARMARSLEALSEGRLLRGDAVLAIEAAERAVALEPLRESAHRCLMEAHAAAGNRGDALRAYEHCRQTLADELGVNPSDATAQVYLRLLGTEPATEPVPRAQEGPPLPLPDALRVAPGFVGRTLELDRLRAAWRAAVAGRRQVVLIGGEAGIGKTGLAAQFALEAHAAGATVLYGRCDDHLNTAYEPFGEALGRYLAACSPDQLREQVGDLVFDLARLTPDLARRLPARAAAPDAEPETERHRLFAATSTFLAVVAERAPLLLIVEDLHWGGTAALLLLRYLTRTFESCPVLVLVTYRNDEIGSNHDADKTLAGLEREGGVHQVILEGLEVPSIEAVIQAACPAMSAEAVQRLAPAILEETGGNTLFVRELVGHLAGLDNGAAEAALARAERLAHADLGIPAGLSEVIRRRRIDLGDTANRLLNVAAVAGRTFEVDVVAHVMGSDGDAILDVLDEVVAARFVTEVSGAVGLYRFTHGVVHGVVYRDIGTTRRARHHARVGAAIEELHGDDLDRHVLELSRHFWEARNASGSGKAAEYALLAGEQTLDQLAYEKAVLYFGRALELGLRGPGDEQRRCRALMALATAQRKAGHVALARDAYLAAADLARRLGDPEALANCALGLAGGGRRVSAWIADEVRISLLEEALEAVGEDQEEIGARVAAELAKVLYFSGRHQRRDALARQALEMARRVDSASALVEALSASRVVLSGPAHTELRLVYADEMITLADDAADPELVLRARLGRLPDLMEQGDIDFDQEVALTLKLADELKQPYYLWRATSWNALRHMAMGQLGAAEVVSRQAVAVWGDETHPDAIHCQNVQIATMAMLRGRFPFAAELWRQLAADYPMIPAYQCMLGFAYAAGGQRSLAAAEFERFAADGFMSPPVDSSWPLGMAALAETCAILGDAARAENLYELLLPFVGRSVVFDVGGGGGSHWGTLSHHLGLLASTMQRWDEAERLLDTASKSYEVGGAAPWLDRTRAGLAEVRLARGPVEGTRPPVAGPATSLYG